MLATLSESIKNEPLACVDLIKVHVNYDLEIIKLAYNSGQLHSTK